MTGGHSLGGACGHIKAHGLFAYQRKFCIEGLWGRHALGMIGRTLLSEVFLQNEDSSFNYYTTLYGTGYKGFPDNYMYDVALNRDILNMSPN